jgi:hypothetical protein
MGTWTASYRRRSSMNRPDAHEAEREDAQTYDEEPHIPVASRENQGDDRRDSPNAKLNRDAGIGRGKEDVEHYQITMGCVPLHVWLPTSSSPAAVEHTSTGRCMHKTVRMRS